MKRAKRGPNAPKLSALEANIGNLRLSSTIGMSGMIDVEFRPTLGISARKLEQLGIDIRSFREPLKRSIKSVLIPSIQQNFDSGGRPSWEPLAASTLERRQGSTPLVRTGQLNKVATQQNIWTTTEDTAMVKSLPESVKYGYYHQAGASKGSGGGARISVAEMRRRATGGARARRLKSRLAGTPDGTGWNLPQRKFFLIQPEDHKAVEKVFLEWFEERVARQWPS